MAAMAAMAAPAAPAPSKAVRERKALNKLSKREAGKSERPMAARAAAPLPSSSTTPKPPSGKICGNFQIFVEDAAAAAEDAPRPGWETGTETQNRKENTGAYGRVAL